MLYFLIKMLLHFIINTYNLSSYKTNYLEKTNYIFPFTLPGHLKITFEKYINV